MSFYVYILLSSKTNKYYCGQTNNIELRLAKHNNGEVKSTKHGAPWNLIKFLLLGSRTESMNLEKVIKGRGIERWLQENH
jgi:putative endonuclease